MPTSQVTYSEPTITRSSSEAVIEFDYGIGDIIAWESIRIWRRDEGQIELSARSDGPVTIPAPILPAVLAEIDRLVTADDPAPFEPVAAIHHVAQGYVLGLTEDGAA